MARRLKVKLIVFLFLTTAGLIAGFFFSGLLNLALSGSFREASQLMPNEILKSLAENERHRMLLLCTELIIISGMSVIFLMNKRETYESDVSAITETIETPIAIGQGQHGSARWLKKPEQRKTFSMYRMDKDGKIFSALLEAGAKDRKDVKKYEEAQAKATEAANADNNVGESEVNSGQT